MEAVNQLNCLVFGNLGLNVLADGRRAQPTKSLSFVLAGLVGLNGRHQHVVPNYQPNYFSSKVRLAIDYITPPISTLIIKVLPISAHIII